MTGRFVMFALVTVALGTPAFAQTTSSPVEYPGTRPVALTSKTTNAPVSDAARKAWFGQAVGTILSGEAAGEGRSSTTAPSAH